MFSVPSLVLFPFLQSGPPILQQVFLDVLLAPAAVVATLRLNAGDHVDVLEVDLDVLAYALFDLLLGTPAASRFLHAQSANDTIYYY